MPVLTGSIVQLTAEVESPTTVAKVNELFADAAMTPDLVGILQYTEEPIVSSDVIKSSYSSVLDAGMTIVAGETQVSLVTWYDNEWGYATRLVDLTQRVLVPVPVAV